MPVYKNESSADVMMEDIYGVIKVVSPDETFTTYKFYNLTDVTRLSVEPLKNRNSAITEVTLGAEAAHTLQADTKGVLVINITGNCTVKPQVTTAVPIILNNTETSPIIPISLENYPCDTLLLSGSGTCTVQELKWL